jgi:arginase
MSGVLTVLLRYGAGMSRWDLFGVPYTSMARPGGIADASRVLRSVGLAARVRELGVHDEGDLAVEPPTGERGVSGLLNERALRSLIAATRDAVGASLAHPRKALLVGGDCPVILGALAAVRDAGGACGLVMFDGHEDAWLPTRSATGEASDSELAIAIGRTGAGLSATLDVPFPLVDASRVALLGARDAAEIAAGGESSVRDDVALFMDDREIVDVGGEASARAGLDAVGDVDVWVHVDLDVLATDAFRAADYLQPGGLGWSELDAAFGSAIAGERCRGASVAIYNPDLDPGHEAAEQVVDFIARSLRPSAALER